MDYQLVKYCLLCKKRFVVMRTQAKKRYCSVCQVRIDKTSSQD
ncbi:MAG: hypothetical protein QW594_02115 [Candidatus Woesearchaeota archaeon]